MGRKKAEETPQDTVEVEKEAKEPDKFQEALKALRKKHGKEAIQVMVSGVQENHAVVSTGSLGVDEATGVGGIPLGRIIEIYGPESSGKTTFCNHVVANAQKMGLNCAYVDSEHAWDPTYAQNLGVQLDRLAFSQPDYGEQALDIVETLVDSGAFSVIVIDSVAALTPKAELDGEMVDDQGKVKHHVGEQARMMSSAMRKLCSKAERNKCMLIFVNQLRSKIGVMYGNPETTTGGNALKFYTSMRFDIRRTGKVEQGGKMVGSTIRVKVVKNKLAPPFREAELELLYGEGFDRAGELLDRAVEREVLTCHGGRYKLGEKQVAMGREAARQWARGEGAGILSETLGS